SVFFQAEDGIRDRNVTGVQTCALPISVKFGVVIKFAAVGVEDLCSVIGSVQWNTDNRRVGVAIFIQLRRLEEVAAVGTVTSFHPANYRERIPSQIAFRPGLLGDELRVSIGTQSLGVDAGLFR